MAKKQVIVSETAAAAAPARAAKPRTPRVKAAQHSKASSSESVPNPAVAENSVQENTVPDSTKAVIAQIAYEFWEARGRQAGSPLEDWIRAEHEYRQRTGSGANQL